MEREYNNSFTKDSNMRLIPTVTDYDTIDYRVSKEDVDLFLQLLGFDENSGDYKEYERAKKAFHDSGILRDGIIYLQIDNWPAINYADAHRWIANFIGI